MTALVNVNAGALIRVVSEHEPRGREYKVWFFRDHRRVGTLRTLAACRRDAVHHARVIADHSLAYRGLRLTFLVSAVTR